MSGGDTGVRCIYCDEILVFAGDSLCWKPICHAKATDKITDLESKLQKKDKEIERLRGYLIRIQKESADYHAYDVAEEALKGEK